MSKYGKVNFESTVASEIIKRKLLENDGVVTISLLDGKLCRIFATSDGYGFTSDKLNKHNLIFAFSVFDIIVQLLQTSHGYRATKGNAHGSGDKVGYGKCTEDTVVGFVARHYFHKNDGESVYDPTFVLVAVLDWAGIAKNCRGYIELSSTYISSLQA